MNTLMKMSEKKRIADPQKLEAFSGSPQIDPDEIILLKEIGQSKGQFGKLYHGKCRGLDVAVKIPKKQNLTQNELDSFRKEVEIMSKMFSPNIALFMGASTKPFLKRLDSTNSDVQGNIMIVSELMKGDLESLLLYSNTYISLLQRMLMAKDIAQGMAWLHGGNPVCLHRDLKLSNLLYDETGGVYVIKVCDFGLSQIYPKNTNISDPKGKVIGTILMTPPEVLRGQEFNEKADVYSFSLVLWQLLTRLELFPELRDGFIDDFIEAICQQSERPPIPIDTPQSLRDLLRVGWSADPSERPSFSQILQSLEHVIVDAAISDEQGRLFWKKQFLGELSVDYDRFEDKFYRAIQYNPTFEQRECLKALLVTELSGSGKLIVTMEKFGKILGWFGPLQVPYSPNGGFLHKIEAVCSAGWFFGEISTQESVNKLVSSRPGTFLVRFGNNPEYPNGFCITKVTRESKIIHIRVLHDNPMEFSLLDGHKYKSLEDLIGDPRLHLLHAFPNPEDMKEQTVSSSSPFSHIFRRRMSNQACWSGYRDVDDDVAEDLKKLEMENPSNQ